MLKYSFVRISLLKNDYCCSSIDRIPSLDDKSDFAGLRLQVSQLPVTKHPVNSCPSFKTAVGHSKGSEQFLLSQLVFFPPWEIRAAFPKLAGIHTQSDTHGTLHLK